MYVAFYSEAIFIGPYYKSEHGDPHFYFILRLAYTRGMLGKKFRFLTNVSDLPDLLQLAPIIIVFEKSPTYNFWTGSAGQKSGQTNTDQYIDSQYYM